MVGGSVGDFVGKVVSESEIVDWKAGIRGAAAVDPWVATKDGGWMLAGVWAVLAGALRPVRTTAEKTRPDRTDR